MNDMSRGVVVIKYHELGVPWLHGALVPWRDYVPVKPDLSDLVERLEWLRANDEAARTIAESGRRAVAQHVSSECIGAYWLEAVRILAEAQRGTRERYIHDVRHNFTESGGSFGAGRPRTALGGHEYVYQYSQQRAHLHASEILCTRDEVK